MGKASEKLGTAILKALGLPTERVQNVELKLRANCPPVVHVERIPTDKDVLYVTKTINAYKFKIDG